MKTVLYVAGKSGGHIIPALTLIDQQKAADPTTRCVMVTTRAALDTKLVSEHDRSDRSVRLPLSGSTQGVAGKIRLVMRLFQSFSQSIALLYQEKPTTVVSMGGLVSVPVCLAAWILRIPVVVYELNVEPGKAVKFLSHVATTVYVTFPEAQRFFERQTMVAEYPLRFQRADSYARAAAGKKLEIDEKATILVIFGGSQGSRFLNNAVIEMLANWPRSRMLHVLHQTGNESAEIAARYAALQISATVVSYVQDVAAWYNAADLIITRAGSGALHELIFFKKRAVIIPLEIPSTDHQLLNAQIVAARSPRHWRVLRQHEIATQADCLLDAVHELLADQQAG